MITSEAKGAGRCVAELPGGRGQKRNGTGAAWPPLPDPRTGDRREFFPGADRWGIYGRDDRQWVSGDLAHGSETFQSPLLTRRWERVHHGPSHMQCGLEGLTDRPPWPGRVAGRLLSFLTHEPGRSRTWISFSQDRKEPVGIGVSEEALQMVSTSETSVVFFEDPAYGVWEHGLVS